MRHYETIFIISPELADEDTSAVIDKFTGILTTAGAVLAKVDPWGRRRLAYEVKKFNKGFFVLLDYGADSAAVAEMERNFKIDERVIRYLTVKKANEFDAEAAAAEAEAAKKRALAEQEDEELKFHQETDEEEEGDEEDYLEEGLSGEEMDEDEEEAEMPTPKAKARKSVKADATESEEEA